MRFPARLAVDVLAAAVVCVGAGVMLARGLVSGPVSTVDPALAIATLTVAAAAVGAGSAILSVVVGRLFGDLRMAWLAPALVLYCVVVLPWTAAAPGATLDVPHRLARLVAYATALILLVVAVRPPQRAGWWGGWVVAALGAVATVASLTVPGTESIRVLVEGPIPTFVVLVGWAIVAVGFVADALRKRSLPRARIGLGLVVIAAAQLYRLLASTGAAAGLAFGALRLIGLAIVLLGVGRLAASALSTVRRRETVHREELETAARHMERAAEHAAERDHELRNGLAGLAGITHLLGADGGDDEHARLKLAVLSELGRLHRILDGEELTVDGTYSLEPVLTGLVALRAAGPGEQVDLHVEPGLQARGDSAVLSQIVTNLLANCDRHAHGAPVLLTARQDGAAVVVDVRDHGPGLPAGDPEILFERGTRDIGAGGTGLGLHISRRLAEHEGGSLVLRPAAGGPGTLARLRLVAADGDVAAADRVPAADESVRGRN
ncbi:HAMP domain-containing sensor histidine kinase [Pseudonocardia sp. N23]|uniref:sensor histidine kinase n=1 Tax=Pseudonocardia sp. N23 TaxID=1987376 RepID=UPI0011453B32|nr:HAMP domain-containing sensor histidine kinase [Pseudonocardia sp. N23]